MKIPMREKMQKIIKKYKNISKFVNFSKQKIRLKLLAGSPFSGATRRRQSMRCAGGSWQLLAGIWRHLAAIWANEMRPLRWVSSVSKRARSEATK